MPQLDQVPQAIGVRHYSCPLAPAGPPRHTRDMGILLTLVAAAVVIGGGVLVLIMFLVRRPPRRHGPEADYDDAPRRPAP